MKQALPVKKNDDLTLTILSLTSEGQGVARVDGYTVFVEGALPEETVSAHVIKVTNSYAIAKVTEVLTPSPDRVEPRCPSFARCGGCVLQHLSYPAQLINKRQFVVDALTRLGGVDAPDVREVVGMDDPWRYRNKGSFPFGMLGNGVVFGFYAARSHRLIPIADCPIQSAQITDIAQRVCAWANENRVDAYDEATKKGKLRHVMARVTSAGETMAVVVTRGPLKAQAALLSALEDVDSVWHNQNDLDTNIICSDAFTLLAGKATLTERIADKTFAVSPQSFLQVNPTQTGVLYELAANMLDPKPHETIVDAYCGVGTISLILSGRCKRVIGIEQVEPAVADAIRNAEANGVENAAFLCADVAEALPGLIADGVAPDAIVLDPPRKGADEAALAAIAASSVQRVVYVSCNPATLARDVKYLCANGFRFVAATPVDMFPHTAHVETVVLITRAKE